MEKGNQALVLILHVDNYVLVWSLLITLICSIIGTQGTEQDN